MQTFTLDPKDVPIRRLGPFSIVLLSIGSSVAVRFAVNWFWPVPWLKESFHLELIKSVAFGALLAPCLIWAESRRSTQPYRLTVDDDEMIVDIPVFSGFKRSVHRGEIIFIHERKHGLVVSNYGPVLTIFLGSVWIPKKLPEYNNLKLLARNWVKSPIA